MSDKSETYWRRLIAGLPETQGEFLRQVQRLERQGAYETARDVLGVAIHTQFHADLVVEYARVQIELGEYEHAASLAEPVYANQDANQRALAVGARALAKLGRADEARRLLERAREKGAPPDLIGAAKDSLPTEESDLEEEGPAVDETSEISAMWANLVETTADFSRHGTGEGEADDTVDQSARTLLEDDTIDTSDEEPTLDDLPNDDFDWEGVEIGAEEEPTTSKVSEAQVLEALRADEESGVRSASDMRSGSQTVEEKSTVDRYELFPVTPADPGAGVEGVLWTTEGESDDERGHPPSRGPLDTQYPQSDTVDSIAPSAFDTAEDSNSAFKMESIVQQRPEPAASRRNALPEEEVPTTPRSDDIRKGESATRSATQAQTNPATPNARAKDEQGGEWEPGDVLHDETAGADSDSDESEGTVDVDERQAVPAPVATQKSADVDSTARTVAEQTSKWPRRAAYTFLGFSVVAAAVVVTSVLVARTDIENLRDSIESIQQVRSTDTYAGWRRSLRAAAEVVDRERAADTERVAYRIAGWFGVQSPINLRRRAARRRVYIASVIEYRFEYCGSRNSADLAGAPNSEEEGALAGAASVYRHLSCGRIGEALEVSADAIETHETSPAVLFARVEALLRLERRGALDALRDRLAADDSNSVYRQYLGARIAQLEAPEGAERRFRELAATAGSYHLSSQIRRAEIYLDRGESEKASELVNRVLQERDDALSSLQRARLRNQLGEANLREGTPKTASKQFEAAIEAAPRRPEVYLPGVRYALESGDLQRARARMERATEVQALAPPEFDTVEAWILLEEGRVEAAKQRVEKLEVLPAERAFLRGRIQLAQNDFEGARATLDELPKREPWRTRAEALSRRLSYYHQPKTIEKHEKAIEKVVDRRPADPYLRAEAAAYHLAASDRIEHDPGRKHLERAREHAQSLVDDQSYAIRGYIWLCKIELAAGDLDKAREACREARAAAPQLLEARLATIELHLERDELEKAETLVDKLSDEQRATWPVSRVRIEIAIEDGRYEEAGKALEDWNAGSRAGAVHLLRGLLEYTRGDYGAAKEPLKQASTSIVPEISGEATFLRAHALTRLGEFETGYELVRAVMGLQRWNAASWVVFGELRRRQGLNRDALENLRLAESKYEERFRPPGRHALLYSELARVWRDFYTWDNPRVVENLEKAGEVDDGSHPDYLFTRGLYLANRRRDDPDGASEALIRALEGEPLRCEIVAALQRTHERFDRLSDDPELPKETRTACLDSEK